MIAWGHTCITNRSVTKVKALHGNLMVFRAVLEKTSAIRVLPRKMCALKHRKEEFMKTDNNIIFWLESRVSSYLHRGKITSWTAP